MADTHHSDVVAEGTTDRDARAKQFLRAGVVLGVGAMLVVPIILAPLAALCGLLALFYGRPLAGAGVVVWAIASGVIGTVLGVLGLALL